MTLVIAFLLMYHIGDFHPIAYAGVFIVWVIHLFYHDIDTKTLARKLKEHDKS